MYLTVNSENGKLVGSPQPKGFCASLALPIAQTCPPSCRLYDECYARTGYHMRMKVSRLEEASEGMSPAEIASAAAAEMKSASRYFAECRPLRLFEAGDARTIPAASIMADAGTGWLRRGGKAVWGYTHSWRWVPVDVWESVVVPTRYGPRHVSMFASVETGRGVRDAVAAGYVPALVVDRFPNGPRIFEREGVRFIPCPAQTTNGRTPCVRCQLCFDTTERRRTGTGIAFEAHGNSAEKLRRRLNVLRDGDRRGRRDPPTSVPEVCFEPTRECASLVFTEAPDGRCVSSFNRRAAIDPRRQRRGSGKLGRLRP